MGEMPIRREDIADSELHHDGHRRKIGKRYFRLVRELLPQFDRSVESGLGDVLDVNKRRLHDIGGEMPSLLEGTALEQVRESLIQDEIRRDGPAGTGCLLKNFPGSFVPGIPTVGNRHPSPRIDEKLHAGSSPYSSSSMF